MNESNNESKVSAIYAKHSSKIKIGFAFLVTCLLLFVVFNGVDWQEFFIALKGVEMKYVLLSIASLFLSMVCTSLKLCFLWNRKYEKDVFRAAMVSNGMFMLPLGGPIGVGAMVATLSKSTNETVYQSSSKVTFDTITKMVCILFAILLGFIMTKAPMSEFIYIVLSLAFLILVLLVFLMLSSGPREAMLRTASKYKDGKVGGKVYRFLEAIALTGSKLQNKPIVFLLHLGVGVLSRVFLAMPFFLLSISLNVDVSLANYLWIAGMSTFALLLPTSFGGLGAREGAIVLMLSLLGVAREESLTLSLIYSILFLVTNLTGFFLLIGSGSEQKAPESIL